MVPRIETALNPITALAFLRLATSEPYLLAGEGQFLKVFDDQRRQLIHTERVFDSQAIHGIACESLPQGAGHSGTLLIWGGRSICLCLVSIEANLEVDGKTLVRFRQHMPEARWDDWILDGCFRPTDITDSRSGSNTIEAILVTAHNDLLRLKLVTGSVETSESRCLDRIASGPSSILYSAHMLWADNGWRLLVAAGTVFGEVLLWSFTFDQTVSSEVNLHYRFIGHEGSVFGVTISDAAQAGAVKRVLASCSDDRTVRIWNISDMSRIKKTKQSGNGDLNSSEAGLLENTSEAKSIGCLAMIMGHASRIWGLRFVSQKDGCWDLMSYGEDSTAQTWRVSPVLGNKRAISTPHEHTYQLSHQTMYSYHSGKNLWAMAIFQKAREDFCVATGGADGRITTYKPNLYGMPARTSAWTSQYTVGEIPKTIQARSRKMISKHADKVASLTRNIFDSLKGSWKLLRNLESVVSTYPSGTLEGIASFTERPPTDNIYDAEYLYSESGDFITRQGLTMRATRQYVYRYSRSTDAISVWFVKPDDGSAVDYFFHKLDFRELDPGIDPGPKFWSASGYHLCANDNYRANYSFHLNDSKITQWQAVFDVDGPKKDYTAKATYRRNQAETLVEEPKCVVTPSNEKNRNALGNQGGQNKPDAFKTYTWISENEVLTSTEYGNILVGTNAINEKGSSQGGEVQTIVWKHVVYEPNLSSSCIAMTITSLGIALLTGNDGTIYLYNHRSRIIDIIGKLPSKAGFLKAHSLSEAWNSWSQSSHPEEMIGLIATYLGSSQATVFILLPEIEADGPSTEEGTGCSVVHKCHLTLQPKFIVTSSCFLDTEKCIILGSRNGDIAIYTLAQTALNLALDVTPTCFQDVHGEDTITLIQMVPRGISKFTGRPAIITAGRDGKWAIHHIFHRVQNSRSCVSLETIHVGVPPFGPNVEGAFMDSTSKDLLLWGFRSKQFVVWNESQKTEVMAVDCGGAHRNWAYTHNQDGSGGGSFVYTKASVWHIHSQTKASHQVIQHGGHGREIKAMALSPAVKMSDDDNAKHKFVATGAEDTTVRIFDLNARLKCLSIITKHTTGIQQLRWSSDGHLLFSAAGCEEFFVWRVQSAPLITLGVVCEAQCPTVTEEVDLRIMDFTTEEIHSQNHDIDDDVAYEPDYLMSIVYSDSSVRIFRYHTSPSTSRHNKPFNLLSEGSYTTYCLTQATYLPFGNPLLSGLCTASTDGHLAFWPLPNPLLSRPNDAAAAAADVDVPIKTTTRNPSSLNWTTRTALHQNSIKALDRISISQSESLIVTGGDDGAIAFTRVGIHKLSQEVVFDTASLLIPSAHASAVTGVVFLGRPEFESESKSEPEFESEFRNMNDTDSNNNHNNNNNNNNKNSKRAITLATVGNDQRLKLWHVSIHTTTPNDLEGTESGIEVKRVANVYTSIADASALGFYRDEADGRGRVVVVGIGVERWEVGDVGLGLGLDG